jgi:hypothetical protein
VSDLFRKLVEVSSLSPLFAENALRRALLRAGIDPGKLTASALVTALPELEKTICTFVPEDAEHVMKNIRALGRP